MGLPKRVKPVDHDKLAALNEDAVVLQSLVAHPGWEVLRKRFEERKARDTQRLVARMLVPGGQKISEEEQIRHEAFYGGFQTALDTPESVISQRDTLLRKAQKQASLEQGDE